MSIFFSFLVNKYFQIIQVYIKILKFTKFKNYGHIKLDLYCFKQCVAQLTFSCSKYQKKH